MTFPKYNKYLKGGSVNEPFSTGNEILSYFKQFGSLKKTASTHGGEWHGPCPVCGGHEKHDSDRFMVWPMPHNGVARAYCRKCKFSGGFKKWQRKLGA